MPITSLPFHHPRAADTVALSFHKTKLTLDMQLRSMGTRGLRLIHVVRLWQIIEEKSCAYGLFSLNCWWFASVVWENLTQLFPGELPVATHDPLLKRVIKSVGPDTSRETEAVTRHFLAKLKLEFKLETTFLESVDHSPSRSTFMLTFPLNCRDQWHVGHYRMVRTLVSPATFKVQHFTVSHSTSPNLTTPSIRN